MSSEKLFTPTTTDNSLSPSNFCLIFKGSFLKQRNATSTPPNRINYFIVYKLDVWSQDVNSYFTLKECLFGGAKLAKNTDLDKYLCTGYDIRFDSRSDFSLPDGSVGKNVIIFGDDMILSVHFDSKNKDILILGKRSNTRIR